jgi:hypothetical protein
MLENGYAKNYIENHHFISVVDEAHALLNPISPVFSGNKFGGWCLQMGPQAYHVIRQSQISVFLMDGRQSMDVYKNLAYEAYVTVMVVDSLYHGEVMSQSLIDSWNIDYECVYDTQSYDNGKIVVPAFLLEPVEITSDNMVQELVDNYGTYVLSEDGSLQVAE